MIDPIDIKWQILGKKPQSNYIIMEALSDRYGWTPDEIRGMKIRDLEYYIAIIQQKVLIEKNGK